MALQFSVAVRTARAGALTTALGASPELVVRTGAPPATCAAADSGTALAPFELPADPLDEANGIASKVGTWEAEAVADGTAGHFRMYTSGGACHAQGSAGAPGSGADLILDNAAIATGQTVTITAFTLTEGGG